MGAAVVLLVAWSLLLAIFIVIHLVMVWRCVWRQDLAAGRRALALLPPTAPVVAWAAGYRGLVVAWGTVLILYGLARVLGPDLLLSSAP